MVLTLRPPREAISVTPDPGAYCVNTLSSRRDNICRTEIEPLRDRGICNQQAYRRPEVALASQRGDDGHVNQIDPVALAHEPIDTERDNLPQRGRFGFHGEYYECNMGIAQLELPDGLQPVAV